jgi:tetratricopeptide (TPR) repeat protein
MALVGGRLRAADQAITAMDEARTQSGSARGGLVARLDRAFTAAWLRNDRAAAGHEIDAALARTPLSSLPPANRPHLELVRAQSYAGRIDAAKAVLADFDRTRANLRLHYDSVNRAQMVGDIALAEKRYDAAATAYRSATASDWTWWLLPDAARAYDLGGHPDSAIAVYARYVNENAFDMLESHATQLAPSLKRLGELYEAKGDKDNAIKQYTRFVELWKNADPELQPQVRAVQERLRKLTPVERPR